MIKASYNKNYFKFVSDDNEMNHYFNYVNIYLRRVLKCIRSPRTDHLSIKFKNNSQDI